MLKKQVLISFLSVIIIGLTGLVSIPILTRLLSPEEMGKLFTILAIVSIMQIFEGLKPVIINRLNDNKYQDIVYLKIFHKVNWTFIWIGNVIIFVVLFFILKLMFLETLLFTLTYTLFSLMSAQWALLEFKNYLNYASIFRTAGWVLTYSLFIIFAYVKIDLKWYIVPVILMYFLLYLFFKFKTDALFDKNHNQNDIEKKEQLRHEIFKDALTNIKIQISAIVLLSMDKVIVPAITGYSNFAYFAIQSELITKSYLINTSVRRALFPYLAKQDTNTKLLFLNKLALLFFVVSVMIMLWVSLYSDLIIELYAGDAYKQYSVIFSILLFIFPANILGAMGILILHSKGDFNFHYTIYRNIAIISLPIFTVLTYFYGIFGAAIALLLTRNVDLCTYLLAFSKYICNINRVLIAIIIIVYSGVGIAVWFHKPEIGFLMSLFLCILLYDLYRKVSIA